MSDEAKRGQCAENMRFYADMRFKQLTVLLAAMTLAAYGVAHYDAGQLPIVGTLESRALIAIAALLFTAVMWVMEVRAVLYWRANRDQAPELCPRPKDTWYDFVNATSAVLLLHVVTYSFWLWGAFEWGAPLLVKKAAIGLLLLLLLYSGASYLSHGPRASDNQGEPHANSDA